MRRTLAGAATAALALTVPLLASVPAAQAAPSSGSPVVINEVYGGGGNSGATWKSDFVELHNKGATAVDLSTWSLQYKSSTGATWSGKTALTGSIQPGSSYLVKLASGTGGTQELPTPDATGTIAMSGSGGTVALVSDGTTLTCTLDACATAESVVDLVGWGSSTTTYLGSGPAPTTSNATSVSRTGFANTVDNAADFTAGDPSPVNSGTTPDPDPEPDLGACGEPATLIHQIQGSGTTFDPAFDGDQVVEGVVSAVKPGLGGFYVQEETGDADADPATSEGIFVYLGSSGGQAPEVGSTVRVAGTVAEFGSNGSVTQLTAPRIAVCEVAVVEPVATPVTFPLTAPGEMERYEGMLVTFQQELVISEYFNYGRFGEIVVALPPNGWDRLYTPTSVVEPGDEAVALAQLYARSRITIDDSSTQQNPADLVHPGNGEPFSLQNRFRGGDTITGITGVVDHSFGLYRVQPTEYGEYSVENPRPQSAPEVGGELKVASFNVLNYFLTLDNGTDDVCGGNQDLECRGADTEEELDRQRAKILAALVELDADVVGLMEMENTPGVEPAADLVAGLNEVLGAGTYDYVDTGVIGTDAIRLGLLYKPGTVTPVGDFDVLDSSDDPRFVDTKSRPMLTQTFDAVADGARFTVSVNHLKSKGSDCDELGDPDTGDGQGNCNLTRTAAAEAIVDHLATDPTGSGDPDFLVIGDLNAYDREDPIDALVAGGYVDQIKRFGGEYAYGYVFDGQAGYLDHALASASLDGQVTGAAEWHINADEPSVLDYDTSFKPDAVDAIYAPDPYRSSDHDAVLVGLDLRAPAPAGPTCQGLALTIRGTSGADTIVGTAGRDVVFGGDGDDVIDGRGGDDVVCGGSGDDLLVGRGGDDSLSGQGGDDRLDGGGGTDVLSGDAGADSLFGGSAPDELYGGAGPDRLEGGGGVDLLDGGPGRDVEID